jgi:hypothetical protein
MKKIKTFQTFNESIFNEYDKTLQNLLKKIKKDFDLNKLNGTSGTGAWFNYQSKILTYNHNDLIIKIEDKTEFSIPEYKLIINNKTMKCSFITKKMFWFFLDYQWRKKVKIQKKIDSEILKKDISEVGIKANKYNL